MVKILVFRFLKGEKSTTLQTIEGPLVTPTGHVPPFRVFKASSNDCLPPPDSKVV